MNGINQSLTTFTETDRLKFILKIAQNKIKGNRVAFFLIFQLNLTFHFLICFFSEKINFNLVTSNIQKRNKFKRKTLSVERLIQDSQFTVRDAKDTRISK